MKKITSFVLMPVVMVLLAGAFNILKAEDISRVLIEQTFDVSKNANLVVRHEFGSVKCTNWDKDAISIKLTARTNTSDQEQAEKAIACLANLPESNFKTALDSMAKFSVNRVS